MRLRLSAAVALLALAVAAPAGAQSSASGSFTASATVLSPISIVAGQNLAFGRVGQSTVKTIAPDDADSGRFRIQGNGTADFSVTFTFPASLANGGNTMPIDSWTGTSGSGADAAGGASFTPVSGAAVTRTLPGLATSGTEQFFFRIGASVTASGAQAPGTYTGTISINAVYLNI